MRIKLRWISTAAAVLACTQAAAQALPAAENDPAFWPPEPQLATAPQAATPPSFRQLSAPRAQESTATTTPRDTAPQPPSRPEGEPQWLMLAGLAALMFIARRHQRGSARPHKPTMQDL